MQPASGEESTMDALADRYRDILRLLGENPDRDGLMRTPERAARSMRFFCQGYATALPSVVAHGGLFEESHDELVVIKDIDFFSMCEHHLVPFFGHVTIGYVPGERILGLSKFARIVDVYSRRLQLQERLTTQIAEAVEQLLNPKAVAVLVDATHLCMVMRGVQKMHCSTVTSSALGQLRDDPELWAKFMQHIQKQ